MISASCRTSATSNDPAAAELVRRYDNAKLINVKDDPITVLTQIAQCRCVLSSSLHG